MADAKLSALTEVTTLANADEIYANDGGVSKRITAANAGVSLLANAGVTSSVAELNILDGVTADATEINLLDGLTVLSGDNTGDEVAASTTVAGVVERSTSAENVTGTDDTVYPTVAGAKEVVDVHSIGGSAQSWGTVTGSRSAGVTYTNTTGTPIQVSINILAQNVSSGVLDIDGINVAIFRVDTSLPSRGQISGIVPEGSTYTVTLSGGSSSVVFWAELR